MADRDLSAVVRLVNQIQPALARADRPALKHVIEELVRLRAPMGGQWQSLAQLAARIGELGISRRAFDLHVEASGGSPAVRYQRATFLAEWGWLDEAEAALRALPEDQPSRAANTYSRAVVAFNLGKHDEARNLLERVVELRPQTGSAWLMLAMSSDLAQDETLLERLVAAERGMAGGQPVERAALCYALGKTYADRGEHAAAVDAFARGAQQMKAVATFDRDRDRVEAQESLEGYDAARIAAMARVPRDPTGRTIFVTGLPRSGTTLVEQILTSHPAVGGGAETSWLATLAMEVGGRSYPALARYVEANGVQAAVDLWHHLIGERFPGAVHVVDKSVDTSRFLGLAASLLPDAPLIWLTRDPLDRAWSCFRTNFLGGAIPWSYDLEDIAAHFRVEDELLARWQEILGERLLIVPYEELVSDPQAWTGRLLAHCGLAEDPRMSASHENGRAVATASMLQVRRPIHREAVGSAGPYRQFLEPFVRAYYR